MKLLVSVSDIDDIFKAFEGLGISINKFQSLYTTQKIKISIHEIDILLSGKLNFETSYAVTKAVTGVKYNLVLHYTYANSWKVQHAPGTILNIINEKPGDFGVFKNDKWEDCYDLNWINREQPPHKRGGFINTTTSYMNIFLPYKKAVGITVNHPSSSQFVRQITFNADCETTNGLACTFACLAESQNFYHLAVIEKNEITSLIDRESAQRTLQKSIQEVMQKLILL